MRELGAQNERSQFGERSEGPGWATRRSAVWQNIILLSAYVVRVVERALLARTTRYIDRPLGPSKQVRMRCMHVLVFAGNNVHPQICTDIKNAALSWLTAKDGDRLISRRRHRRRRCCRKIITEAN